MVIASMMHQKFISSVVGFAALVMGMLGLVHFFLPPFWGNPGLSMKVEYLDDHGAEYSRLFLGSSHILRQVDPQLFDSILNDGTHSFNLGMGATYAPEAELVCEWLLDQRHHAAKEIYLEVSPYLRLADTSLASSRNWYMVNPAIWWSMMDQAWETDTTSKWSRFGYMKGASLALLKATLLPNLFNQGVFGEESDKLLTLGRNGDGFVPLDELQALGQDHDLDRRRTELLRDTLHLQRHADWIRALYRSDRPMEPARSYCTLLHHLVELGDRRGIKIYFILPPLISTKEVFPVFRSLPPDRQVDLCNPDSFPQFYQADNAFDRGHLNNRGSRLFTLALAEAVQRKLAAGKARAGE